MAIIETRSTNSCLSVLFHHDGEVVASAFGGIENNVGSLDTVQVNPKMRGRGIGKQVVSAFLGLADRSGATAVVGEIKPEYGLRLEETREMYRKLGFVIGENDSLRIDL